jgi:hypothetical protein
VRDAPIPGAVRPATDLFINTYGREYPAAVVCFTDDLNSLLASTGLQYTIASECAPPTWLSAASSKGKSA